MFIFFYIILRPNVLYHKHINSGKNKYHKYTPLFSSNDVGAYFFDALLDVCAETLNTVKEIEFVPISL